MPDGPRFTNLRSFQHYVCFKHLPRYVAEFGGRHNGRAHDTGDQFAVLVRGMDGKRLGYEELVGPKETRLNRKKPNRCPIV